MDPVAALNRFGGYATRAQLWRLCTDHLIASAVADGSIVRLRRGRYTLPLVNEHRREAHRRSAVVSHLSAAASYGWRVKTPPTEPWLTVPRKRKVDPTDRVGLQIAWRDLPRCDVVDGRTSPVRTVIDCATRLPFDEALAVADSALRSGLVRPHELVDDARSLRGIGAPQARAVAAAANAEARNPLESVLRAICLGIPEIHVRPQVQITGDGVWAVVDLADERLRLVIEAEGFEFHGNRRGLMQDCRRHTTFTVLGWSVLRFTWEDVMLDPAWVRWAITSWLAQREGRAVPAP